MTGERLRADGTETLVPTLRRGDTVILDNLAAHKVTGVREAKEAVGARLLDLPPDSPDFNPIERAFAQLKAVAAITCSSHSERTLGRDPTRLCGLQTGRVPQRPHRCGIRRL
jgi:transposase